MGCRRKYLVRNMLLKKIVAIYFFISMLLALSPTIIENVFAEEGNPSNTYYLKTWTDSFDNPNDPYKKTDMDLTNNVEIDTSNKSVKMKHTYPFWNDTAWKYMKNIKVTNNHNQVFTNYILNLMVQKDDGMKEDYSDIGFKIEGETEWLGRYIENYDSDFANVWVNIPTIEKGQNNIYMLYNNIYSDFDNDYYFIFENGNHKWSNDRNLKPNTFKTYTPDVSYGITGNSNEFLIVWSENKNTGGYKKEIMGTIWDVNGERKIGDTNNPNDCDGLIYSDSTTNYRNENPSVAYGAGKWFVAWERYNPSNPTDSSSMDIYARIVQRDDDNFYFPQGDSPIQVCSASGSQANPKVAFDSVNNRFCVVWEDARTDVKNIYGKIYTSSGQLICEKPISTNQVPEITPSIAFDPIEKQYLIAWQNGSGISICFFNETLDSIGNLIHLTNLQQDYAYKDPCVAFCEGTSKFLVTWNFYNLNEYQKTQGKLINSSNREVWGDAIDIYHQDYGSSQYDVAPYLTSSFIISYKRNDNNKIYVKLINSFNKEVTSEQKQLSKTNSNAQFPRISVYDNNVFGVWESYTDNYNLIYANIWNLTYSSSYLKNLISGNLINLDKIKTANLTSTEIPSASATDVVSWGNFTASFSSNTGSISFDILDSTGEIVLKSNITSGQSLDDINTTDYPVIRLRANFLRENASYTPILEDWSVSYYSTDSGELPEVTITYDDPRRSYKHNDIVKIKAIFQDDWENTVFITLEDAMGNIILSETQMEKKPPKYWSYDWTVNSINEAEDGYVTVYITADINGDKKLLSYDTSKKIDNTPPIITKGPINYIEENFVIIFVELNENCQNTLQWGSTPSYGSRQQTTSAIPFFFISELFENSTCYYKIESADEAGNTVESKNSFYFINFDSYLNDAEKPVAITGGPYKAGLNEPITFNGTASYAKNGRIINYYIWDFDNDGAPDSYDPITTYSYDKVGKYTVSLRVVDNESRSAVATTNALITEDILIEIEELNETTRFDIKGSNDSVIVFLDLTPSRPLKNVAIRTTDYGDYKPHDSIIEPIIEDLQNDSENITMENISIYRYVDILIKANNYNIQESDIKSSLIVFRVKKEWIENNGLKKENIFLLRNRNNSWQNLNTSYFADDEKNYFYYSHVPGFSTFAVVGSKIVEKGPEDIKDKPIPWILIFGFIISAVIILIFILFKTRFIYIEDSDTKENEEEEKK